MAWQNNLSPNHAGGLGRSDRARAYEPAPYRQGAPRGRFCSQGSCPPWFVYPFAVVGGLHLLYSQLTMLDYTETLRVGAHAPEFSLEAANREGVQTLSEFLKRGPLILEFLRGTW